MTNYTYYLSGPLKTSVDAKGQATSYSYDDLNRLTSTAYPDTTSESRTYDPSSNLLTRTSPNGSLISYTYDAANRLVKVSYPGSGGTVAYTYDQDGNRLSMVNPYATDYYSYDSRDRLTNQTEYVGVLRYQLLYAYDGLGKVLSIKYPDAYLLSMTYDGLARLKTVSSFATLHYTVNGKVSKILYGNGEVTTYSYDKNDRPRQILDTYHSTKEMDLNYSYDGTGNVLTINGNSESYGYDWLNRLTSSTGPWGSYTYVYDQVGNRIRMVQGSTTTVYCYGSFNRLTGYYTTTSCNSPAVSYTYDSNGNVVAKTGGWAYSYDYENRLTKVVQSGTTKQQNYYDGDGNRVKQVVGSSTFTYSFQGLNILYEKNVTGSTTTITKHFYAGSAQVAKMVGTTVYYLHEDALGSTRLVATASVTVTFSSNYVPYGQNYGVTGREVFMYTGKPLDSATGLYYYGARYYDDSIGRFITQDSYGGRMTDPQSLDRYVYARDNPERYTDLDGHYAGRMFTDADDPGFMATLAATTAPSGQTTYLAPTTTSTTYVGGSTVTTSTTTFVEPDGSVVTYTATGTTTRTTRGTATSTTGRTTAANPTELGPGGATEPTIGQSSSQNGLFGALAVIAGGMATGIALFGGGLDVASQIALRAGAQGTLAATIELATPLAAGAPFLFAAGFTTGYVIRTELNGQTPTTQGAWNAFWQGLGLSKPPFG
jgi:RHS repeat-associated protein